MIIHRAVKVIFDDYEVHRQYTYGILPGHNMPSVGDLAIAPTPQDQHAFGFAIVKIVEVDVSVKKATKFLVNVIPLELYQAELRRQEREEVVQSKLNARMAQIEEEKKFEFLRDDPIGADLLKELESLRSNYLRPALEVENARASEPAQESSWQADDLALEETEFDLLRVLNGEPLKQDLDWGAAATAALEFLRERGLVSRNANNVHLLTDKGRTALELAKQRR